VITLAAAPETGTTPCRGADAGEGGSGSRLELPVSGSALIELARCHGVRVKTATVRPGTAKVPVPSA
jgi:hypothetical protein